MKNAASFIVALLSLVFLSISLTGCQAVGDIFGAGVYVGVFAVVFVIVIIVVIVAKMSKKG